MAKDFRLQGGQTIVEIILAVALTAIVLPGLLTGFLASREGKAQKTQRLQSTALLRESVDAVKSIREKGWNNGFGDLSPGNYHPVVNAADNTWKLDPASETIGNYTRTVTLSDVYRDPTTKNIAATGNLDPSTKRTAVTVSWQTPRASSVTSTLYLTRYLDNVFFKQPSPTLFSAGPPVLTNTSITGSPEQVKLNSAGTGRGDWCTATPTVVSTLDLPNSGIANTIWAIPGQAFAGTGTNASGLDFVNISITNPLPPTQPSASQNGSFSNNYKTNDIFGETNYAYIATSKNQKHVVFLNINPPTVTEEGSVNLGVSNNGTSVFVLDNFGYVTAGNKLYAFDVVNKTLVKRPPLANVTLAGNAKSVYVVKVGSNTYAYVATTSSATPLQIVDTTNLSLPTPSMTITGSFSPPAPGSQGGQGVYGSSDGTRAYLVTTASTTQPEFFIINTVSKSNPQFSGSYDLGANTMSPQSVNVVLSKYRALIVGTGGSEQYIVLRLEDEQSPVKCTGMAVSGGSAYDVASVVEGDGDSYAYIVTSDSAKEFQIIEGGSGGSLTPIGTFESTFFDANPQGSFNRLKVTMDKPTGTDLRFKVAAADTATNCAGATYAFVGPAGDPAVDDYFSIAGVGTNLVLNAPIPVKTNGGYKNPARCIKYRGYFTTTSPYTQTSVLKDATVNYAP